MSSTTQYRKGSPVDLRNLRFEGGLSLTAESVEFNVLGMGHEFWVAVQRDVIIALAVLVEENDGNRRILHLEVAPPRKNEGVGSALVKAIIKAYPKRVLSVVPFAGAEEFYTHLGFSEVGRWEMRRDPRAIKH